MLKKIIKKFFKQKTNWISKIKQTESKLKYTIISTDKPKKVLFYSVIPWDSGCVEHFLAKALHLRGHDVTSIYCDYKLPVCGMENNNIKRCSCIECKQKAKTFFDAFNIKVDGLSKLADEHEINKIIKDIKVLAINEMFKYEYKSIPVGKLTETDLPQYFLGIINPAENESKCRQILISGAILAYFADKLIEKYKPDTIVLSNGKSLAYSYLYHLAKSMNIKVVTWEETGFIPGGYVFNTNNYANEFHLEEIWADISNEVVKEEERNFVANYFKNWETGKTMPFKYYTTPISDINEIKTALNIDSNKKIITIMTNLTWDTSALGRDIAFTSMLDWIYSTIDYVLENKETLQLIIRVHPAEKKIPMIYQGGKTTNQFITEHYGTIPEGVYLIEGDSEISSYTLIENSNISVVYTSTLGLEMALKGKNILVAGDVHYRDKGFTTDILSKEQMLDIFNNMNTFNKTISKEQQDLAIKYAYALLKRHLVKFPYLNVKDKTFEIKSFNDLLPNKNPAIEKLCQCIIYDNFFIDITP
ncbi:MAG: hypothetical protein WCK67_04930 [bacterium]